MSLSLGAVGLSAFHNPFADFFAKGDLRSMFCLIVFLIVSLVLAYLTNPSENSFRAYLTEQSFRHHLSHLDENAEDPHATSHFRFRYGSSGISSTPTSPFHFANRASIALRTPKHVFHSFGIFTIAAMLPLSKTSDGDNREGWMISDSWYIGAFGKWWRGGVLEAWYQDVIARSKDEESWSSGILSMKRLDMLQDYNGPTFSAKNLPSHLLRGSPPKLRNRERPASRHNVVQPRSSTPPPLPKTVSLPLHTTRKSSSNGDRICDRTLSMQPQTFVPSCMPSAPSRSPSTLFEHSPQIAEVLRQITTTKASVNDLRNQLTECESAASQSRALLQQELETHRDRKRQEDASKLELKTRTKSLEDSKRGAESNKKDAEKKLKAAQSCRDGATQRMEFLDKQILGLQQDLSADREFILNHQGHVSDEEREVTQSLEEKRQQIKASEDLLLALNQRSRELEEKLASEKERLRVLRAETDRLKQNRAARYALHEEPWPYTGGAHLSSISVAPNGDRWGPSVFPVSGRQSSSAYRALQDDRGASLGQVPASRSNGNVPQSQQASIPSQQFPSFDTPSHGTHYTGHPTSNSGIYDNGEKALMAIPKAIDYSNGSVASADNISRSFKSDSDAFVEKDWHRPSPPYANRYQNDDTSSRFSTVTSSPTSWGPDSRSFNSSFDFDFVPEEQTFVSALDSPVQLQSWGSTDAIQLPPWGPVDSTPSKGLNPDAKEFNLFRKPAGPFTSEQAILQSMPNVGGYDAMKSAQSVGGYDALNPNGLGTVTSSTSSTNQSLLRAFAPSPAEREALQRALGGSSNTSFERLPSLSDVGSIPASPTHAHALPQLPHISHHPNGRDLGSILPLWLQGLPRASKVNFSPWEDEEPSTATSTSGSAKEGASRRS